MSREYKKRKLSVGQCEFCKKAETMDMVQCDYCDKWFHFHCAGVGPEVVHLDWSCYVCKNQQESRKAKNFQGRHDNCKKPVLPKINYLKSQSKNIESADKRQIRELSENLAELKVQIGLKNGRIDEQNNMIEVQQKQLEEFLTNLAALKVEIGSMNDRIDEQRSMLEVQQKRIDKLSNVNDLGNDQFKKRGDQQQGVSVKEVVDVENEVDSVAVVRIFMNLLFDTEEELAAFNKKLRDPKLICGLQDQFCIFGGDLKTFIIGMVNRIMSKNLQSKLSWSGKRTSKPGLAEMSNITDLIHFCCAKKFGTYDTKAGEQILQKLLQNA